MDRTAESIANKTAMILTNTVKQLFIDVWNGLVWGIDHAYLCFAAAIKSGVMDTTVISLTILAIVFWQWGVNKPIRYMGYFWLVFWFVRGFCVT